MIVHISFKAIADSILAASAMAATGSESDCPPLLTTDHAPMLESCARAALRSVCFELAPFLDSAELQGEPADLEFVDEVDPSMSLPLEGAVCDIVAHRVLHMFFINTWPALSDAHLEMAALAMERLQASLMSRPGVNFRIKPGV
ncbi:MAG: hypothetical protein K2L21_04070 [Muribaculaceae bacterium]|nr:hypothetical protein [Muribaculaceae bacterium]